MSPLNVNRQDAAGPRDLGAPEKSAERPVLVIEPGAGRALPSSLPSDSLSHQQGSGKRTGRERPNRGACGHSRDPGSARGHTTSPRHPVIARVPASSSPRQPSSSREERPGGGLPERGHAPPTGETDHLGQTSRPHKDLKSGGEPSHWPHRHHCNWATAAVHPQLLLHVGGRGAFGRDRGTKRGSCRLSEPETNVGTDQQREGAVG